MNRAQLDRTSDQRNKPRTIHANRLTYTTKSQQLSQVILGVNLMLSEGQQDLFCTPEVMVEKKCTFNQTMPLSVHQKLGLQSVNFVSFSSNKKKNCTLSVSRREYQLCEWRPEPTHCSCNTSVHVYINTLLATQFHVAFISQVRRSFWGWWQGLIKCYLVYVCWFR